MESTQRIWERKEKDLYEFDVHVTVQRDKFLIIKPIICTNFSNLFGMKLYMFWAVTLYIIGSFSLYAQQWYMSTNLYNIYHCCAYSEKLPMMDRVTAQNM